MEPSGRERLDSVLVLQLGGTQELGTVILGYFTVTKIRYFKTPQKMRHNELTFPDPYIRSEK